MERRNVVNIINFVRGCDQRQKVPTLYTTLSNELELIRPYGFKHTVLMQYDAIARDDLLQLVLSHKDEKMEVGIWIEIVRPLIDRVGLDWRGKPEWDWDWHINPGFLMAYTQSERVLLIDEIMRQFKEVFGAYPKSAGSWLLDAFSVEYMQKKYGVCAFCICREQFGVDAYTLWGGYFNQGYYPSKRNMLCPAQTPEDQVNAPIFRMLGPDPIYNYTDRGYPEISRGCPTIEPYWEFGHTPSTVDWFFKNTFDNPCLAFSYIQLGQENSFPWDGIAEGLSIQFSKLSELVRNRNDITVETLSESGEWFRRNFKETPSTALCATDNWYSRHLQSFWYDSRRYRCNVFNREGVLWIRDIHLFDSQYTENWYDTRCPDNVTRYDNLPICDGFCWTGDDMPESGLLCGDVKDLSVSEDREKESLTVKADGITVIASPDKIEINTERTLELRYSINCPDRIRLGSDHSSIEYAHNGYDYRINLCANLKQDKNKITLTPIDGKIVFRFEN